MPEDSRVPIILGRPFLATARAMIDVFNKKITLRVGDDEVIFDMDQSIKRSQAEDDECYGVDDLDDAINAEAQKLLENDTTDSFLLKGLEKSIEQSDLESCECEAADDADSIRRIKAVNTPYPVAKKMVEPNNVKREQLFSASANEIDEKKPKMKNLPQDLEYAYLYGDKSFPIIISSKLSEREKIKQDAKPRLIRWILLLQGFDIKIKDKKGAENLAADHLSRLENPNLGTFTEEEIVDKFPDKHLMILKTKLNEDEPWYADYVNYIVGKIAFKLCPDNIMRRCVAGDEIHEILAHCHSGPTGGPHSASITGRKVYEAGFFWPSNFKDAKDYVMRCDACQRSGNISSKTAAKNRFMELNELMELRDGVYENTRIYKKRTKKWHDSRLRRDKNFKVGDKVLLFNSRFKMHPGKLKSRWYGLNVVKTVYPYGTIEIIDRDEISFKVNGQRLKKYHDEHTDAENKEVVEFKQDKTFLDTTYSSVWIRRIGLLTSLKEKKLTMLVENLRSGNIEVSEAPEHPRWVDSMQEELYQFSRNKVWTLVPAPYGKTIIGSKWYPRTKGMKLALLEAIRIFLAFATYMNFTVYQMDVKSAFLNGKLKEEAYAKQPPGFECNEFPNHVCKLDKALYELKQAPRAWYETLSTFLTKHKFVRVKTLMVPPNNLGPDLNGKSMNETQYIGMIGSLMYLTASRPDINSQLVPKRKSTSGACQLLGGKLVCWSAKKQQSVALSLAKAEYVAPVGCCANIL
ncbi:DNA-directed DNA polymerase [Tanacetum coccineum]